MVHNEFIHMGFHCTIATHVWDQCALHVCFGAHMFPKEWIDCIQSYDIIYNLEQMGNETPYNNAKYLLLLHKSIVWDYNQDNQRWLNKNGIYSYYVPILYSTVLLDPLIASDALKDIDVLFYGAINEKRKLMMGNILKDPSIVTFMTNNCYEKDKESLIRRSKIVINIHHYDCGRLELVRLAPLMANGCFVLSEPGSNLDENKLYEKNIVYVYSKEDLYAKVLYYLSHPKERDAFALCGKNEYRKTKFTIPTLILSKQ